MSDQPVFGVKKFPPQFVREGATFSGLGKLNFLDLRALMGAMQVSFTVSDPVKMTVHVLPKSGHAQGVWIACKLLFGDPVR